VLAFMRERGRVDDRFEQRRVGVRHGRNELLGSSQRAARVSLPQFLRQNVDEADAVVDRALVERIGADEAVEIIGAQVRHHRGGPGGIWMSGSGSMPGSAT